MHLLKKIFLLYFLLHFSSANAGVLDSLMKTGTDLYLHGEFKKSTIYFSNSIVIAKKENNKKELSNAYNNLGNALSKIGESVNALKYYQLSISIAEENNDQQRIAKTTKNIGTLYSEQKDFSTALRYFELASTLAVKLNDSILIADCLNNQGVVYEQQNKYDKAVDVYSKALEIYTAKNEEGKISMSLNNLAIVYKYLKKYPQSIKYYEQALALSIKQDDKFIVAATLNNLGNVYALIGDYDRSLSLCQDALKKSMEINATEIIIETYDGISIAYEKLQKYPEAIAFRKRYEEEKFNFISSERSGQLAELKTKYDSDKQLDEIALLKKDETIKNLSLREQEIKIQKRNYLLTLSILLIFMTVGIAYQWNKSYQLKSRIAQQHAIKVSEENERIRIAKDIHDELGSGLTKINFLSETVLKNSNENIKSKLNTISETSKNLIDNMRDLIWALNPDNSTLDNLIVRIREYTTDYLEEFPIELTNDYPDVIADSQILKESHRNIFMAVKEILNNVVKHSGATSVSIKVNIEKDMLNISINDNGNGFESENSFSGNGIKNMKHRISISGGRIDIESAIEKGTTLKMIIPLANIRKS